MKYTWLISMKSALRVYVHSLLLEGILENTIGYPKRILWIGQRQLNESVLFCRGNKPFLGDNSREKLLVRMLFLELLVTWDSAWHT